jgi:hypothetical protein
VFKVKKGKITGLLPARSVVVIYKSKLEAAGEYIDIKNYYEDVEYLYVGDTLKLTLLKSENVTATYEVNGENKGIFHNGQKIEIGDYARFAKPTKVRIIARDENGNIEKKSYYFKKQYRQSVYRIKFEKSSKWNKDIYCYMYGDKGEYAPWPGIRMRDCGDNTYELITELDINNNMKYLIFNDIHNQVSSDGNKGFVVLNHKLYDATGKTKDID